ncbi:MAG: hypothetical protein VKJ02_08220 [Snowella sp.]|nr:hypothetical protein [Snowella sp.]
MTYQITAKLLERQINSLKSALPQLKDNFPKATPALTVGAAVGALVGHYVQKALEDGSNIYKYEEELSSFIFDVNPLEIVNNKLSCSELIKIRKNIFIQRTQGKE